jgi:FlaA1/EpsC-like NDP-sugar epimerase
VGSIPEGGDERSRDGEGIMASSILVTGGTGTLGRFVVARLRDAGPDVRVLTRRARWCCVQSM